MNYVKLNELRMTTCFEIHTKFHLSYINGLVQDCSITSANALEILQSCTNPSIAKFPGKPPCPTSRSTACHWPDELEWSLRFFLLLVLWLVVEEVVVVMVVAVVLVWLWLLLEFWLRAMLVSTDFSRSFCLSFSLSFSFSFSLSRSLSLRLFFLLRDLELASELALALASFLARLLLLRPACRLECVVAGVVSGSLTGCSGSSRHWTATGSGRGSGSSSSSSSSFSSSGSGLEFLLLWRKWTLRHGLRCLIGDWWSTKYYKLIHSHLIARMTFQWQFQFNTLRPEQNARYLAGIILKGIFLNENLCISIPILLKFIPQIPNDLSLLVQIMTCCHPAKSHYLTSPQGVQASANHCWGTTFS